jgi:hypothetical protein
MSTPEIKKKINQLHNEVKNYSPVNSTMDFSWILKDKKLYIYIPIFLLILIWILKPNCVYDETIKENKKVFSYKKFVLLWLFLSVLSSVALYALTFENKK